MGAAGYQVACRGQGLASGCWRGGPPFPRVAALSPPAARAVRRERAGPGAGGGEYAVGLWSRFSGRTPDLAVLVAGVPCSSPCVAPGTRLLRPSKPRDFLCRLPRT